MSNLVDTVSLGERPTTKAERAKVLAMIAGIPDEPMIATMLGLVDISEPDEARLRRGYNSGDLVKSGTAAKLLGVGQTSLKSRPDRYPATVGLIDNNARLFDARECREWEPS